MQSTIFIVRAALVLAIYSSGLPPALGATADGISAAVQSAPKISVFQTEVAATNVAREPVVISGFGMPLASEELEGYHGGFDLVKNDMQLNGTVANNSATNISTGINSIADGSFTNVSGLPMVIQNSGSNVLIQNATIINLQFK